METINKKPKLVDRKILYQINNINNINNMNNKKFIKKLNFNNLLKPIYNILFEHMSIIIFFIFLSCSLYYRYYEVKNRKNNINKFYTKLGFKD